ncbi:MAG: AAA family ATPase [Chloroflexi bacterium]|nr:AAA family ATPase [Chloroflexota bacterium]
MIHLQSITVRKWRSEDNGDFPFNLPILQSLPELTFSSAVTFFVGENGSGKSTLLEAIACAVGSTTVGSESVKTDKSLTAVRQFAAHLQLSWRKRTHKGFFLRAEDFFGYAKRLAQMQQELEDDLNSVDQEYEGRSKLAADLAKTPYMNELHEMRKRYGSGLDAYSHGESFLALFQSRFVPGGLYLLDEPEAPLSPIRQLALIAAIKQMVAQEAQFIIATHSPIIMAFPDATLWHFEAAQIQPTSYDALEHVRLTRDFLNNPEAYLRHL